MYKESTSNTQAIPKDSSYDWCLRYNVHNALYAVASVLTLLTGEWSGSYANTVITHMGDTAHISLCWNNFIVLYCTAWHLTELHFAAQHCPAVHSTAINCTASIFTVLHCTALYTALHYTAIHCNTLLCTEQITDNCWEKKVELFFQAWSFTDLSWQCWELCFLTIYVVSSVV